jgi:hypothetical protein
MKEINMKQLILFFVLLPGIWFRKVLVWVLLNPVAWTMAVSGVCPMPAYKAVTAIHRGRHWAEFVDSVIGVVEWLGEGHSEPEVFKNNVRSVRRNYAAILEGSALREENCRREWSP